MWGKNVKVCRNWPCNKNKFSSRLTRHTHFQTHTYMQMSHVKYNMSCHNHIMSCHMFVMSYVIMSCATKKPFWLNFWKKLVFSSSSLLFLWYNCWENQQFWAFQWESFSGNHWPNEAKKYATHEPANQARNQRKPVPQYQPAKTINNKQPAASQASIDN